MRSHRYRTRLAAATGAAAVIATTWVAPVAQAEPFAGKIVRGTARFAVTGADGLQRTVDLLAESTTGSVSSAFLEVKVQVCTKTRCLEANRYGKTLDPAELEVAQDGASATLRTDFAGEPVLITWTRETPRNAVLHVGASQYVEFGNFGAASVSGNILGFSCNALGELGDMAAFHSARPTPQPPAEPKRLPEGFTPRGKARPACAD